MSPSSGHKETLPNVETPSKSSRKCATKTYTESQIHISNTALVNVYLSTDTLSIYQQFPSQQLLLYNTRISCSSEPVLKIYFNDCRVSASAPRKACIFGI